MKAIVGANFIDEVIPLIKNAKKNIDIVSYDWRWYSDQPDHPIQIFNIAVANAIKRGVFVRAVLNNSAFLASFLSVGIRARALKDKRTLHAKMILIDDEIAIVGSHNLSKNAMAHNVELSLIADIPEGDNRLKNFFNNLYGL